MTSFDIPRLLVKQPIDSTHLDDSYTETRREMERLSLSCFRGDSVAITASSRGITDIVPITRGVIDHFRDSGLVPFLVPAMGSHAGGTAESQMQLLCDLGLTESQIGCSIRSSVETIQLGELVLPREIGSFGKNNDVSVPIHFDRIASEADHVFLVNRIKSHTRFSGPIESGLLKILVIGLGNAKGASQYHSILSDDHFSSQIMALATFLMQKVHVLGGVGIVENALGKTMCVRAMSSENIVQEEQKLLQIAKENMVKLPFEQVDLLFIGQIGKNISGTGFDTNVVGRKFNDHKAVGNEKPNIARIAVCGLTSETHGNANGIGMAEFCLRSLLAQVDWKLTRLNAMTANHVSAAMIPLDYETENDIIQAAWESLGCPDPLSLRIVWIRDTLHLEEMIISESLREESVRNNLVIEPLPISSRMENVFSFSRK
ncbi:MAG: lactate racemase domain-containing protein [Thermoguttaceae bacterium]